MAIEVLQGHKDLGMMEFMFPVISDGDVLWRGKGVIAGEAWHWWC